VTTYVSKKLEIRPKKLATVPGKLQIIFAHTHTHTNTHTHTQNKRSAHRVLKYQVTSTGLN